MEVDRGLSGVNCLVCGLNPITPADFDGLCLSCRAAVADALYRVEWVEGESERYRVVVFATSAEHPLGTEFPNYLEPIVYEPQKLRELFRAAEVLDSVTAWG